MLRSQFMSGRRRKPAMSLSWSPCLPLPEAEGSLACAFEERRITSSASVMPSRMLYTQVRRPRERFRCM